MNLSGNGGAEAHARFKQYEYRANASLVLTSDSRRLETDEPTGEAESLWGKIDPKTFGDGVSRVKLTLMKKRKELDQPESVLSTGRQRSSGEYLAKRVFSVPSMEAYTSP